MADEIQIVIERGKKKAVAYAPDWPGWSRGASSTEAAIERLGQLRRSLSRSGEI